MLARVAEHLYWLSRYVERAEATARLAIAHLTQFWICLMGFLTIGNR